MQITDEMVAEACFVYQQQGSMRAALEAALGAMPECESDLVKRLRNQSPALGLSEARVPRPITYQAAACIEYLAAALRPFVEAADDGLDEEHSDDGHLWESPAAMNITAGDLRRARATLEKWGLK